VFRPSVVVAAALFAALAGLVAAGTLHGLDQWAVEHAMPGGRVGTKPTLAEALVPFLHANLGSPLAIATEVVALPASVVVSLLVLLALRRRRWIAAWLAVTVVEEVCKASLERPALYRHGVHVAGFDSSFPSGHSARALVLAAAVASARPGARLVAAAWAASLLVLLELGGWHTPSDVVGGIVLAAGVLAALR
jgi:membrane-associated phospholipid phosphatase